MKQRHNFTLINNLYNKSYCLWGDYLFSFTSATCCFNHALRWCKQHYISRELRKRGKNVKIGLFKLLCRLTCLIGRFFLTLHLSDVFRVTFHAYCEQKIIFKNWYFKICIVHIYTFNSAAYFSALYFCGVCRSQCPRVLSRRSTAARLLRSCVRILPWAWMFVCCVLSGRGLCDELIACPEESYRRGASLCVIRKPLGRGGCSAGGE
jgi:hypothetical protein